MKESFLYNISQSILICPVNLRSNEPILSILQLIGVDRWAPPPLLLRNPDSSAHRDLLMSFLYNISQSILIYRPRLQHRATPPTCAYRWLLLFLAPPPISGSNVGRRRSISMAEQLQCLATVDLTECELPPSLPPPSTGQISPMGKPVVAKR
jgi:hypothetical protein